MKTNLDSLMQERNLDALLVVGPGGHNPAMVYLTGGAHLTDAYLIKKRGQPAQLLHRSMERDEAAMTGLETINLDKYRLDELFKQAGGDLLKTSVALYERIFADLKLTSGRVAVYGQQDAGQTFAVLSAFQQAMPELTLVGEMGDTLLLSAMATKDNEEVARIRRMGKITTEVVANTADYLTSHRTQDEVLVKTDGQPLTIGEVKTKIDLWLIERGAENPKGTIFAIGHDAGVPHSTGLNDDLLRLGQTIIFDIFPCEKGGGYFHDFTRTWCLGYATDEALSLYEDVLFVYDRVKSELKTGAQFKNYQILTCDLFKERGHPTGMEDPTTEKGYVHGLGHGVGLHVHERPFASLFGDDRNRLDPGVVFTIEPGLYYPDNGLGIRLEDTIWMNPDGGPEVLAEYPLDLVLPMKEK